MTSNTQTLRRDLQGMAADLKWSAVEIVRIAERLSQAGNEPDAQALHRMIAMFQREESRLSTIVNEIAAGRIVQLDDAVVGAQTLCIKPVIPLGKRLDQRIHLGIETIQPALHLIGFGGIPSF